MAKKKLSAQTRRDLKQVFEGIGVQQLQDWISQVANGLDAKGKQVRNPNPGRAAELMLSLAEYVQPKLARVEQLGPGGGPLRVIVKTESA